MSPVLPPGTPFMSSAAARWVDDREKAFVEVRRNAKPVVHVGQAASADLFLPELSVGVYLRPEVFRPLPVVERP